MVVAALDLSAATRGGLMAYVLLAWPLNGHWVARLGPPWVRLALAGLARAAVGPAALGAVL